MWKGFIQLKKLIGRPRVGIVCMTKHPVAFDTWMDYHRKLGICHFFIRIEDTPGLMEHGGDNVTITRSNGDQTYMLQMNRQNQNVNESIAKCKGMDITHLLHIDDDELLYCPNGFDNFCKQLTKYDIYPCLHLRNYEALAPHENVKDPFKECIYFKTEPKTFTAYANGKSIACLKYDVEAKGPHYFSGFVKELSTQDAVVLHYESMILQRWKNKFTNYLENGNKTLCDVGKIPFQFYCESMDLVNTTESDEYWKKQKMYDGNKVCVMIDVWS